MRAAALLASILILCGASLVSGSSHEPPEPAGSFRDVPDGPASQVSSRGWTGGGPEIVDQRAGALPVLPERSAIPIPSPRLIVVPRSPQPSSHRTRGIASRMGTGFGRSYLALPEGPGHRVRICARRCLTMTSTDAGPSKAMQRAGRVCDMNDWAWQYVTGLDLSRGLGYVTVEYL